MGKAKNSNLKQTKTAVHFGLTSVPIMQQLFTLPAKLSRTEIQHFDFPIKNSVKYDIRSGSTNNRKVFVN